MLCCRAPFLMQKQMHFSKNDAVHRIQQLGMHLTELFGIVHDLGGIALGAYAHRHRPAAAGQDIAP